MTSDKIWVVVRIKKKKKTKTAIGSILKYLSGDVIC